MACKQNKSVSIKKKVKQRKRYSKKKADKEKEKKTKKEGCLTRLKEKHDKGTSEGKNDLIKSSKEQRQHGRIDWKP